MCTQFVVISERDLEERNLHALLSDGDPVSDRLNDLPPMLPGKIVPTGGQVLGILQDFLAREHPDPEHVTFGFQARQLVLDLTSPLGERPVVTTEVALGDLAVMIEIEQLALGGGKLLEFGFGRLDERFLLAKQVACRRMVRIELLRREQEVAEFGLEERFERIDRDLVAAARDRPRSVSGIAKPGACCAEPAPRS